MKFSSCSEFQFLIHRSVLVPALAFALFAVASPVSAHVRVHERHYYVAQRVSHHVQPSNWAARGQPEHESVSGYHPGGTVTVSTAAGPITVAADAADKFVSLTNDLVAHGFHGSVNCAATGHMPNSLHHTGHACDFAQTARNRTVAVMYHVSEIIAAHGLRDGCSFGDCGHVDTGTPIGATRLASASRRYQSESATRARSEPASQYQVASANIYQSYSAGSEERRRSRSAVASWSSWYGGGNTTTASFTAPKQTYGRRFAQETGRSVYMRVADGNSTPRERFVEVNQGAVHTFAFAHHGFARRRTY